MKYELVIDSRSTEVVIALLKKGKLIELHKEMELLLKSKLMNSAMERN